MQKLFRVVVWMGLALCLSQSLFAQADPNPDRFSEEIDSFVRWDEKNAFPAHPVLFVGSSSIRFWHSAAAFPDLPVVNRGFGGSHISDVNHFLDRVVLRFAPSVIVFYAGDNDIAAGKTPERVLADYRTFVERVQTVYPGTPIIFIPIKPSLDRWQFWSVMKRTNALVEAYSKEDPRLYYADTATPMLGVDGRPRPSLFAGDGLHLSSDGYRLWEDVVRRYIERARQAAHGAGKP